VKLTTALVQGTPQVTFPAPGGQVLLHVLLAPEIVDNSLTIDPTTTSLTLRAAYRGLRLFGKQALLASRLNIVVDELTTIQSEHTALGWLDWTHFPAQNGDAPLPWSSVAGLLQYLILRNSLPRGRPPFWDMFEIAAGLAPSSPADSIL